VRKLTERALFATLVATQAADLVAARAPLPISVGGVAPLTNPRFPEWGILGNRDGPWIIVVDGKLTTFSQGSWVRSGRVLRFTTDTATERGAVYELKLVSSGRISARRIGSQSTWEYHVKPTGAVSWQIGEWLYEASPTMSADIIRVHAFRGGQSQPPAEWRRISPEEIGTIKSELDTSREIAKAKR
jgi:hypothetical protein